MALSLFHWRSTCTGSWKKFVQIQQRLQKACGQYIKTFHCASLVWACIFCAELLWRLSRTLYYLLLLSKVCKVSVESSVTFGFLHSQIVLCVSCGAFYFVKRRSLLLFFLKKTWCVSCISCIVPFCRTFNSSLWFFIELHFLLAALSQQQASSFRWWSVESCSTRRRAEGWKYCFWGRSNYVRVGEKS